VEIYKTESLNLEDVADALDPPKPRDTDRWHVSNLIESAQLITKGDIRYHEYEGVPKGIMSMGRIWEAVADTYTQKWVAGHIGYYWSNVVAEKDDVVASLDGILLLPEKCFHVVEIKLRFTANTDIPFRHQQQLLAYCAIISTDLACYVDLHLTSNPPSAEGAMRFLKFTQQEIVENWQMITATKAYLESNWCRPGNPRGEQNAGSLK